MGPGKDDIDMLCLLYVHQYSEKINNA